MGARYNNFGKAEVKYRDLDLRLLTAGEINICSMYGVSQKERNARMKLLGDVVFNSSFYQWHAILKFHAAVLSEIQDGNLQWGEDYYRLEQQMLMPFPFIKTKTEKQGLKPVKKADVSRGTQGGSDRVIFCADFQKKTCTQDDSHYGWFFGNRIMLHHVCGVCLKESNQKAQHSPSSGDCPNKKA